MAQTNDGSPLSRLTLLAVDDDADQLERLRRYCQSLEYPTIEYFSASGLEEGLRILNRSVVDLVMIDCQLPDANGLELLSAVKAVNPNIRVVTMTASESARDAVALLKAGAEDYLIKPTTAAEIRRLCLRLFEHLTLQREEDMVRQDIETLLPHGAIVFQSREMAEVLRTVARCSETEATVLITGESGTGKELVAQLIHRTSTRLVGPFVTVNISALPETLVESELFGHKKGSFTGASEDRTGRFEEADGGTLFIDEVGDISLALQVKLLRVVQFGRIERVGENKSRHFSVRIIAATNRNLLSMVQEGKFRSDLYYRLNVIPIHIPPLRERKTDIPVLVDHLIQQFNVKNGRVIRGISREAMDLLMRYPFPGNVRELENLIERAGVLCRGEYLRRNDFPDLAGLQKPAVDRGAASPLAYDTAMRAVERDLLERALREAGGNQCGAARLLGISERRLRSRLYHLGLANQWRPESGVRRRPSGAAGTEGMSTPGSSYSTRGSKVR